MGNAKTEREKRRKARRRAGLPAPPQPPKGARVLPASETEPNWSRGCAACGETPVVPVTGLCGPCTFGEAETAGGNW